MLTVLIETENDEDALARTLATLIVGAVEGVVRDVIVCDRGSTDQTHSVAEHAGCSYVVDGGIAAALRQAKGEWILMLEPGARLLEGWIEDVSRHIAKNTMPARFTRYRGERRPMISRLFAKSTALQEGLVIRREQALSLAKSAASVEALARGLASKRLEAEIRPADRSS